MPDPSFPPPPLPSKTNARVSVAVSWILIIAAVSYLTWTANYPPKPDSSESAEIAAEELHLAAAEANELAILKLQGRMLIGLAQIQPGQVAQSLSDYKKMLKTERGKGALAAIYGFINPQATEEDIEPYLAEIATDLDWLPSLRAALSNGVTDTERTELEKTFGWYSTLLKPASDADTDYREQVTKTSTKTFMLGGVLLVAIILAWLTGFALLILYWILRISGQLRPKFVPHEAAGQKHLYLEAFAIYIGIMALGRLLGDIHPAIGITSYALSFLLALFWPKIRGAKWKDSRKLYGWNRGTGFFREVGAGIVGYMAIIFIASIGLLTMLILTVIVNQGASNDSLAGGAHPIIGALGSTDSVLKIAFLLFTAAGLAPLLEETMFRGALYRFFRHRWGFFLSSVIGGIIFAIIHPQGWVAVPALAAMGIGFALLREWRDSLIASMTAHAINNGAIVGFMIVALG